MIVVKNYEMFDICFSHSKMNDDETEFDVEVYQDKEDTMTELMNLFANFIIEGNYELVHNISVVNVGCYEVVETWENGVCINTEEHFIEIEER